MGTGKRSTGCPGEQDQRDEVWMEGGTARGCGGVCGWSALSASMPCHGSPHGLRTHRKPRAVSRRPVWGTESPLDEYLQEELL